MSHEPWDPRIDRWRRATEGLAPPVGLDRRAAEVAALRHRVRRARHWTLAALAFACLGMAAATGYELHSLRQSLARVASGAEALQ